MTTVSIKFHIDTPHTESSTKYIQQRSLQDCTFLYDLHGRDWFMRSQNCIIYKTRHHFSIVLCIIITSQSRMVNSYFYYDAKRTEGRQYDFFFKFQYALPMLKFAIFRFLLVQFLNYFDCNVWNNKRSRCFWL